MLPIASFPPDVTASALDADLEAYLAERAVTDWSPSNVRRNRCILRRLYRYLARAGHRRWATVTAREIDDFMLVLVDQECRRSTLDGYAWSVRGFGAWLLSRGKVLRDPTAEVRVLGTGEEPLPPPPLSEGQVADLFNALPRDDVVGLRNRLHLAVLYACGLRSAEAVSLDVGDLDLDKRTILVRVGKGGFSRMLPLLPTTLTMAADYLAMRRDLLRGPDHGALFLSPDGRRIGALYMSRYLAGAGRTIGFHVHPHLLRHSIAVHLLRRGADIRYIQQFLGHASLETTKIYLRLVPGHLREDYDKAMPCLLPHLPWKPPAEHGAPTEQAS